MVIPCSVIFHKIIMMMMGTVNNRMLLEKISRDTQQKFPSLQIQRFEMFSKANFQETKLVFQGRDRD